MNAIPSPLNRVLATQRRIQTQHQKVRPGKVPVRDPDEHDYYHQLKQSGKLLRPQTTGQDPRKKDHLKSILDHEKNKEKKERIQAVLIQRLSAKYGAKHLQMISFLVEEFMQSHDELTSSDLNILEKEVQNAVRLRNIDDMTSARLQKNSRDGNTNSNNQVEESNGNNKTNANGQEKKLTINVPNQRPPSGKEWQVLQVYQSILDEEKIKQEREKAKQSKLNFRKSLDDHMQQSQRLSSLEREEERQYAEHVKKDILQYEEEERKKKEALKKKHEAELQIRKAQIEEQQRRLQAEREAQEAIDRMNLQLAKEKAKQEQEAIARQREAEKEKHRKIKIENEENKRLKAIEKQKEAELDFRLMSEYAAKLDRENYEREQQFLKKLQDMEVHAKKFENEGAGKIAKEEQIRFEQQLLREQEKKLQADLAREQEKERQRKLLNQMANEENARQLAAKQQQRELERERDLQLKEQFKRQENELKEQFRHDLVSKRHKQDQYRHMLDVQVEEFHKVDTNLTGITPVEKAINMPTLKTIQEPEVLTKVLGRMKLKK